MVLFKEIEKSILNFKWGIKGPQTAKTILKKAGGVTLPVFKTCYKVSVAYQCTDGIPIWSVIKTDIQSNGAEIQDHSTRKEYFQQLV